MKVRNDDLRLQKAMKIILQPLLEEENEYIETMNRSPVSVPESLEIRLQSLLEHGIASPYRKRHRPWVKRAMIIAAVILILTLAACMAIAPLRETIFGEEKYNYPQGNAADLLTGNIISNRIVAIAYDNIEVSSIPKETKKALDQ